MKNELEKMSLSRTLLAGLLCGIITSVFVVIYAGFYRTDVRFQRLIALGPTVIFVAIPLLLLIAGVLYYLLVHYVSKGELLFIIFFAVLMLIGIAMNITFRSSGSQITMSKENGFLFGLELITGLAICIFLPILLHHPRIYFTKDEMNWE